LFGTSLLDPEQRLRLFGFPLLTGFEERNISG